MRKGIRITMGSFLLFISLNAFGGGIYGMMGAKEIPLEWLANSPFSSYLFPSLFLFFVIGGLCLSTAIALFRDHSVANTLSGFSAIALVLWIVAQVFIIGYVSWMQPAIFISGCIIGAYAFVAGNKTKRIR